MQFIPLSEKRYPFENGFANDVNTPLTLPKLLTNPNMRKKKQAKSPPEKVEEPEKKVEATKVSTTARKPSATLAPLPLPKKMKTLLKSSKAKNQVKAAALEKLKANKKSSPSVVSQMLNLDMRLNRIKQKVKETLVETSFTDNIDLFEELFKSPALQATTLKEIKASVGKATASSSSPIAKKKPSKALYSGCTACGVAYKPPQIPKKTSTKRMKQNPVLNARAKALARAKREPLEESSEM